MLQQIIDVLTGTAMLTAVVGASFVAATLFMMAVMLRVQAFLIDYKTAFTETASSNLADMFSVADTAKLFMINAIALVLVPTLVWFAFGDWKLALGVFIALALLPNTMFKISRRRRLKRFEKQLPDGLAMMSGSMRAGASLNIALESLVREQQPPLSQEFALFLRQQRIGVEFEASLDHMEKRIPLNDFSMVLAALRISREVGGNLAEVLEALADTLRKKHMMEGKIDSLTAQGRLQGIVMTGLPILLAVLLNFLEPEAMEKLWTTPIGWSVLGVIVFMEAMGYVMIRKITSIDV
jgi:tight adherence protein B